MRVTLSRAQMSKKSIAVSLLMCNALFVKMYKTNVATPSNLLRGCRHDSLMLYIYSIFNSLSFKLSSANEISMLFFVRVIISSGVIFI